MAYAMIWNTCLKSCLLLNLMNPIFQTETWWDAKGPFKILHTLTPLRIQWILRTLSHHPLYNHQNASTPLQNMSILDIGCGGGLLCEPLSRLGARVTGIDQSEQAIKCAIHHKGPLEISYHVGDVMSWEPHFPSFDVICMMEVLEHLHHPFLAIQRACSWLSAKGGMFLGSTLNRTSLSYFLGIKMAENILGWIPKGTHQWELFLTPHEVQKMMLSCGFKHLEVQGYKFSLQKFEFSRRQDINYFFSGKLQ